MKTINYTISRVEIVEAICRKNMIDKKKIKKVSLSPNGLKIEVKE